MAKSQDFEDPLLPEANKPEVGNIKFIMLLLIMLLTFGSYWVFDTPGAIETQLREYLDPNATTNATDSWYTTSKNVALYSVYSYPNVVLAFFGGYIIDSITGLRLGALLFVSLVLLGQFIFALGIMIGGHTGYGIMVAGRFVFGLGGESLTVAQNNYTLKYFAGPYLALAFGLVVSFSRVGSSVNFVVTPALASNVPFAVWFGFAMCCLSAMAGLAAFAIDWIIDRRLQKPRTGSVASEGVTGEAEEKVEIKDVLKFSFSVWLLYLITMLFYIAILTFYTVASIIMQNTSIARKLPGNGSSEDIEYWATFFLSVPNFVSIIMSPVFGAVVDKCGRALYMITIASLMFVAGHFLFLAFANEWIEIPETNSWVYITLNMMWLGTAYSMGASCLWPSLAHLVPPKMVATGYGAMTAVQNAGMAAFPQIIGALMKMKGIKDTSLQYTIPIMIFIGCAASAALLTLWLMAIDAMNGGRLNMSASERAEYEQLVIEEDLGAEDYTKIPETNKPESGINNL